MHYKNDLPSGGVFKYKIVHHCYETTNLKLNLVSILIYIVIFEHFCWNINY